MTTQSSTLPTGTVTFLFTDIEGSTKLLNRLGDRFPPVLEEHQRLLRRAFEAGGGVEVATEGDSFFVVFPAAPRAVMAAVEAQRALARHDWGEAGELRVRMGLHSGEGILGADNYVGVDVHRAARIAAAGHGGQVIISDATRGLVEQSLPEGIALRDVGEHRLKDLPHPERLFQVLVADLPSDFPPPRSLDARPTNLPEQRTTFIGRRSELDDVKEALARTRLLTLTGPGGTGKTRLSLQVGAELLGGLEDGVFFVPLAPLTDPELVIPTIAQALGLREDPQRLPVEALTEHLADKDLLLILDNFEQVIRAAPQVGELLSATSKVKILSTSREPLGLHGEHEYSVPPLGVPDPAHLPPLAGISQYEAVALFIERAAAVKPGFEVTNDNAPAVAEIAVRLDGLPLAIELAAARVKILSPQAILQRLGKSLSLLAGGARDLPARQQTLRGAITWSYDLLDEEERTLFSRLAVFRGGFSLEAVEAVCMSENGLGMDTLDAVSSLVNKSLVRQNETELGEPRFFMLDTIREYASERLRERPDAGETFRRHSRFFLELAETAAPELLGDRQAELLDRLAHEHDNLRAVLDRAGEDGDAETALRACAALWRFWQFRGHLREARERVEKVVRLPGGEEHPAVLAAAYEAAGGIVYWMGDFDGTIEYYQRSLDLNRQVENRLGEAEALYNLSFGYLIPQPPDIDRGRELLEESRRLFEELGNETGLAKVSWGLGNVYYQLGEWDRAEEVLTRTIEVNRRLGDRFSTGWSTHTLGLVLLRKGKIDAARRAFTEALEIFSSANDLSGITLLLGDFAAARYEEGDRPGAARLAGAVDSLAETSGAELASLALQDPVWVDAIAQVKQDPALQDAYREGRALSTGDAVTLALEGAGSSGRVDSDSETRR